MEAGQFNSLVVVNSRTVTEKIVTVFFFAGSFPYLASKDFPSVTPGLIWLMLPELSRSSNRTSCFFLLYATVFPAHPPHNGSSDSLVDRTDAWGCPHLIWSMRLVHPIRHYFIIFIDLIFTLKKKSYLPIHYIHNLIVTRAEKQPVKVPCLLWFSKIFFRFLPKLEPQNWGQEQPRIKMHSLNWL